MKTFVIEITWLNGTTHGWGNGYVVIPKGHPCYEKQYDTIHSDYDWLEVHGGLTFSDYGKNFKGRPKGVSADDWIIGFDTAHYGDSFAKWPDKKSVLIETNRLANQIEKITL